MTISTEIATLVDQHSATCTALADRLWDAPELRWQEHASVEAHIALAESEGFQITRDVAGIPTAFWAEAGSDGPVIAILGEYDALAGLSQRSGSSQPEADPASHSGNGQGCGHHLLGAGSLLAAVATHRYLKDHNLPGRVRYYGCPAEEAAAGKTFMVDGGAFADVDSAVGWHPADTTQVWQANALAYCQSYFSFTGIAAHAGASPHLGRSALDAVELMNVGVNFLREHMPTDCRIHYAIVDAGGKSPNVVQANATAYYIVRAPDVAAMRGLYERVVKIAEGAALMTETSLAVEYDGASSDLLPNEILEQAMHEVFAQLGGVPFDNEDRATAAPFIDTITPGQLASARKSAAIGREDTSPLHDGVSPLVSADQRATVTGSTDVGDVSWVVPTVQCMVACAALGTPAHSWQLVAQGKLAAAHKGMTHAAKIMAATCVTLLTDSDLLSQARKEFDDRIAERPYDKPIPAGTVAPPLRPGFGNREEFFSRA